MTAPEGAWNAPSMRLDGVRRTLLVMGRYLARGARGSQAWEKQR
jgi:hypothetical protein